MSGVGEVIAIVSCVAGLIQAYDAAARRIEKIKKSRAEREAPPPPVQLETSVERGKQQIVDVVQEGRERFGSDFEHGDLEVQNAMLRITVETQREFLEGLAAGREDDDAADFWKCTDASDTGRRRALVVLNEYIMRKTKEERERMATQKLEVPEEPMPRQPKQVQEAGRLPLAVQQVNTILTQRRLPSEAIQEASRPRRFSFFRSSTSGSEPQLTQAARPTPITTQSDEVVIMPLQSRTLSGITLVSNSGRRTTSPQIESSASIDHQLQSSLGSDITAGSTSPRGASISESTLGSSSITSYGGCCKYAHHLRDGKVSKSLGRQNLAMSPGATNFIFSCQSTKCRFQIPAYLNKNRDWAIDDRPRMWKRKLQYTPIFLAKSHVPTLAPLLEQKTRAQYRCIICILFHEQASVFLGHDALLEHVYGHTGAVLNGVSLGGPLSFSNEGVRINGDFDIRLLKSEPAVVTQVVSPVCIKDVAADLQLQHELEKMEMNSKRSSHTTQELDLYYSPWADGEV